MSKKLFKIGLIMIALLNCLYVLFLFGGLTPDPVGNERVAQYTYILIILPVILILLCVCALFVKGKNIEKYRRCSKIFAGLRIVFGEFGLFLLTFLEEWHKKGVFDPLSSFAKLGRDSLFLALGVILQVLSLPIMGHLTAMIFFEHTLEKEMRMKKLKNYKILLVCLSVIAIIGVSVAGVVIYSQYTH